MTQLEANPFARRAAEAQASKRSADERRRHGRFRVRGVNTSVGKVLDISASGMRLQTRSCLAGRVGRTIRIVIEADCVPPFEVEARIVWGRKLGMFRHECGVCFERLDYAANQALATIVSASATRALGFGE